jgi:hypothetical protein
MGYLERALQELHLLGDDLEPVVCAAFREQITQRKGDSSEPAADLQDCVVTREPAVDAQEHAPLLRPPEPLLEDVDALGSHKLNGRNERGLVGDRPPVGVLWRGARFKSGPTPAAE